MIASGRARGLLIVSSLGVALILTLAPLPATVAAARPAFYPATVLFWVLAAAPRFGLLAAWCCGIVLDVVYATPMAEHGLALAAAAYLIVKMRGLLATFPRLQQTLVLIPVFAVYEFVLFWIDGVAGADVGPAWRWLPVLTTGVVWPLWTFLLERAARYGVS